MGAINSSARLATTLEMPRFVRADWSSYLTRVFAWFEMLLDFSTVICAISAVEGVSLWLESRLEPSYFASRVLPWAAGIALLFVLLLQRHGGYRPCLSLLGIRETERILRITAQISTFALLFAYFGKTPLSIWAILFASVLVPALLLAQKARVNHLLCRVQRRGPTQRRAVILGTGGAARFIYTALVHSPKLGIDPVAFIEPDAGDLTTEIYECSYERRHFARVLHEPLSPELLQQLQASLLIIARPEEQKSAVESAAAWGIETFFVPDEFVPRGCRVDYTDLDGTMLAHLSTTDSRPLFEFGKRAIDLCAAAILIPLLAIPAAVIAILVKRSSSGPIVFRQERVGKRGRLFTMYKFRTMYEDAPKYGYSPGQVDDPRVTPVGRFLRRTSLDEVPQLLNVLLGNMSLVGPRPEMPFIVGQYSPELRRRLLLKPGITGLWQISADRTFQIHESPQYDDYYARHRSLFLDVAIMLHTFPCAGRGI